MGVWSISIGLIVFIVYLLCVFFIFQSRRALDALCTSYIEDVESKRYEEAYLKLSPVWKGRQDKESFRLFAKKLHNVLGAIVYKERIAFEIIKGTGSESAKISYGIKWERASGNVTFSLLHSQVGWQIIGITYDSGVLNELIACPNCGKKQPRISSFCSNCGSPMDVSPVLPGN